MGVNNRQRRAAKQKQRRQAQARRVRGGERREVSLPELLWAAVDVITDGDAETTRQVLDVLDTLPPAFAGIVADAVAQQRAGVQRHGWSDDDLVELRVRRLKVPAAASTIEHEVRWLALLTTVPRLPSVAPRSPAARGDEAMLAKIRALLAKAESTTFPDEAEALSAKAQELMARHRIDHVLVGGDDDSAPVGRRLWLDDPYVDAKAQLLAAVARANSCRSIMLTGLGCSHIVGFPTDLDVVELLHTSLLVQATAAMAAAGPQRDARGRSRTRSFRQSFLIAYASRIGQRLQAASEGVTAEVASTETTLLPALVRRERQIEDEIARAFPHAERKTFAISNPAGWAAGTVAADAADLAVGRPLHP
jgi:hypothetical protein